MQFIFTKLGSTLIVIALIAFGYFAYSAIGGTAINVTLTPPADSSAGGPTLATGLVGHWTFDGADMVSNVADISGQGNHGSLQGQTSTTTAFGVLGQALEFDGSDDYVEVDDPGTGSILDFDTGDEITLSAWTKRSSTGNWHTIISKNDTGNLRNYQLLFSGSGLGASLDSISFYYRDSGNTTWHGFASTATYTDTSVWYHVVSTYTFGTPSSAHIYVNGDEVAASWTDGDGTAAPYVSDGKLTTGSRSGGAEYFPGLIDDVRIYNRALSAEEVKKLYQLGAASKIAKPTLSDGLVGHWNFDIDAGGDIVRDTSGQGNNGTMTNMDPGSDWVDGKIGSGAMDFDGSNDSLELPASNVLFPTANTPFSISLWFYPHYIDTAAWAADDLMVIEHSGSNSLLWIGSAGGGGDDLTFWNADTGSANVFDNKIVINTWYHVAITYDGTTFQRYFNGQTDGATFDQTFAAGNSTKVGIGSNQSTSEFYNGLIDDVRIYNRALSAEEVKRLYNLSAPTIGKPALSDGLVGHWNFDIDAGGDIVRDTSGQGNNGTMTNMDPGSDWVDGKIGSGAMDFDGSDDYVVAGVTNLTLSNAFTLSSWVNFDVVNKAHQVIKKIGATDKENYSIIINNTDVQCGFRNSQDTAWKSILATSVIASAGIWTHVACTFDNPADTLKIYINGKLSISQAETDSPYIIGTDSLNIGRNPFQGAWYTDGLIDDVRIYNRALSAEEITRLYNMGK